MSHTLSVFFSLFCMFGWTSVGHCAFSDDLSLLQEHTHAHALPQQKKWPDIGKIVDSVKEAADSAKDTASDLNDTVHDKLDQAANATSTAIQTVVKTLRDGLETVLDIAHEFENNVSASTDVLLHAVQANPDLLDFERDANLTFDAFGTSLEPLASVLNGSIGTVQTVLSASGFDNLSNIVGAALTQALGAIDEANETNKRLKRKLAEYSAHLNKSAGNFSKEIDEDFTYMSQQLHELHKDMQTRFVNKTLEAYKTLGSGLREKVEGVLPEAQLQEVIDSLDTIDPIVQNITDEVVDPIDEFKRQFDGAVAEIREHVPAEQPPAEQPPGGARGAAGFSLLTIVASMCTSFITL